jgi:hypothetical protein
MRQRAGMSSRTPSAALRTIGAGLKDAGHWRQGRLADHLTRMDFVILDELGYLPTIKRGRG